MADSTRPSGIPDTNGFSDDFPLLDETVSETDLFSEEAADGAHPSGKRSGGRPSRAAASGAGRRRKKRKRRTRHASAGRKGTGRSSSGRRKQLNRSDYIHLGILAVIVLMFLIAVIRLIIWNIGEDSGYDPNADTSEFDTEPQDYIQPMDESLLAGHEDDGVETIVCLGNAPFADERGSAGLAELIAQECGAVVHNCAIPDSYLSMKYEAYSDSYPADALSLYLVTASLCGGDYTLMDYAAGLVEDQEGTRAALDTLRSVDFSAVDMIVIIYDRNDYMDGRPVMDENNDINLITWNGALNASIQLIQQTFPHIRIVVLSPAYGQFTDENGNLINADTEDLGNGTLPDYVLHEIDVAMANGVSIIDNYYGAVSENQAAECLTDGWHLNEAGRRRIAQRFAELIFLVEK